MTKGRVKGIIANLVMVEADGPVSQNEICMIKHADTGLMAEVIKIGEGMVYVQVFESTRGLKVGASVEFSGRMLEVHLGPGLLSRNYDGLQNDLDAIEGIFLDRGKYTDALDPKKKWDFVALAKEGDKVRAGSWIGEVQENRIQHKIRVPIPLKRRWP
jgi:V/A-type H+-transporting ATPase subunit A